jgi:TldD protein
MLEQLGIDAVGVLRAALAQGGDFADLFIQELRFTYVGLEGGRVTDVRKGRELGVGVRILHRDRMAYAYGTHATTTALGALASLAAAAVPRTGPGDVRSMGAPLASGFRLPIREPPAHTPLARKASLCRDAAGAAMDADARVALAVAEYIEASARIVIVNSLGERTEDERTQLRLRVQAIATEGDDVQIGFDVAGGFVGMELFESTPPERIGQEAARRALLALGAHRAPTGRIPVVLAAGAGGTLVHEAVGHGLEADNVAEGLSCYAGKLGERVGTNLVTLVDDSTLPGCRGSYLFDDEGVVGRRTTLIEEGVLRRYLCDRHHAGRCGWEATGNGRRDSYRNPPVVRMSNTFIAPGRSDPEEIIRSTPHGILVKGVGGGEVDTVTGDFVFEMTEGYMIEDGQVSHALRGATLAGNGPEVLRAIDRVGDDLRFEIGRCSKRGQELGVGCGQPTLRITELLVGGSET